MRLIKLKVYIVCSLGAGLRSAPGRQVYFRLWSPNISGSCSGFWPGAQPRPTISLLGLLSGKMGGIGESVLQGHGRIHEIHVGTGDVWCPEDTPEMLPLPATGHAQNIHQLPSVLQAMRLKSGSGMGADLHLRKMENPPKKFVIHKKWTSLILGLRGFEEGEVLSREGSWESSQKEVAFKGLGSPKAWRGSWSNLESNTQHVKTLSAS